MAPAFCVCQCFLGCFLDFFFDLDGTSGCGLSAFGLVRPSCNDLEGTSGCGFRAFGLAFSFGAVLEGTSGCGLRASAAWLAARPVVRPASTFIIMRRDGFMRSEER